MFSAPCPRCGNPVMFTASGGLGPGVTLQVTPDPFSLRRHGGCFGGPSGGGEPLPIKAVA